MSGKKADFKTNWATDSELITEGYSVSSGTDGGAFKTGRPRYWVKLQKNSVTHYRTGMKLEDKYTENERLFVSREDRLSPEAYFLKNRTWPSPAINADVRTAQAAMLAATSGLLGPAPAQ